MSMPELKKMSFSSLRGGCRALILLALALVPAAHATSYATNLVQNGTAEIDFSNGWVNSNSGMILQMDFANGAGIPPSNSTNGGFFFDYCPGVTQKKDSLTQLINIADLASDIATGRVQSLLSGEANKYFVSGRAILRFKQLDINGNVLREDSVECISEKTWEKLQIQSSGLHPSTRALKVVLDFRVQGTESGNAIDFDDIQLRLYKGPALTTTAVTAFSATTATLGGNISDLGDLAISERGVVYSYSHPSPILGEVNVVKQVIAGTGTGAYSTLISSLVPNTTYSVQAYASNMVGTRYGGVKSFMTPAIVPTVSSEAVTALSATVSTLNATVNAMNATTTVSFEYGTTTSYGSTASATPASVTGTANTAASLALTGLIPNTTYHYRVKGENIAGTASGTDLTFTTPAIVPTVTSDAATSITATGATLNATVNANNASTTVSFEYGTTTSYGSVASATPASVTGTASTAASLALTGLVPNTTYHYRVKGDNIAGTANGTDLIFTTPAVVPTVSSEAVTALSATASTLNATVNAMNATTTVSFEYGPTTSYGTTASATPASVTGTANTVASLALTGLVPNTIYHYRAVGTNVAGTANGTDMVFMTPVVKPTVSSTAATNVIATSATLNATVNANNAATTVSFEYGTTTSYGTVENATPVSVTGTANTATSLALTGLVPNTTYHYRVKGVNVAGTSDGTDLTFTTLPVVPTATSNVASNITSSSVTLNATVNANNASTTVRFEIGLTSSYGITLIANPATVNGTTNAAASVALPNLAPNTTYYYRVKAVNAAGTTYGSDMTVTTLPVLPTVSSDAATLVGGTSATLNATVNANNAATAVSFEYGTTTSYGNVASATPASVTGTANTAASLALTGLIPNTTYHYRVQGDNMAGTASGTDLTFTTLAVVPTVSSDAATDVTATRATLNATVNANNAAAAVSFEYGTTSSYGSTASATPASVTGTANTAASLALTGLVPNTTYHYRVQGDNVAGTASGTDLTFTTPAIVSTVSSDAATDVTATSATLNATVNANNAATTVSFEYGTTTSYGTVASATPASVTGTASTAASLALTGLVPNTTYHYRVQGDNIAGTASGTDLTFTTPAVVATATSDAATDVNATSATLNATVNANNASTNVSFEYGTSTGYGTEVTLVPSAVDGTTLNAISQQLAGLANATTYHYRIKAVNSAGTSYGSDQVFTTLLADPVLITEAASNIASREGTLHASVNAKDNTVDVHFEYGVTDQYGTSAVPTPNSITGSANTAVSYNLTGLVPNSTYHYRIVSGSFSGDDKTFTTAAELSIVATGIASGNAVTGVALQGTVNAQNAQTTVSFEYGTDNTYGTSVAATPASVSGSDVQSVSVVLSGLKSGTTYHYRIVGVNSAGTRYGDDASFTTPDTQAPSVTAVVLPESKTYTAGDVLAFQVEFSEIVTVSGTPSLALQVGSAIVQALYSAGSGTRTLVFQYALQSGESDADGIALASEIALNAGSIADAAGNQAVLAVGTQSSSGIVVADSQSAVFAANNSMRGAALRYTQGSLYVQVPAHADHLQLILLDVHGRTLYKMPVGDHDFVMAIPAMNSNGSIAVLCRRGQVLATQPLGNTTVE